MVTETQKVRLFLMFSVAGLLMLFMHTSFYYAEIILAVLFCVFLWMNLWVSRLFLVLYSSVLVADLLLLRTDEYTLIFVVAFVIVLYELIEFLDIHSVKTDDEKEHKKVMSTHIRYIGALFMGCSLLPSSAVVIARILRIQIGYNIPVNILIFSAVILGALLAPRIISK
jgi:hypothetical protein